MKNSSLLTLVLLVIASMAFVAGVKEGVADVTQAAFLPIAIFATLAGYLLGQSQWEARRAWALILLLGLGLIFVEASRLGEVLWRTVLYSPTFEFNAILSLIHKEPIDTSYLLSQFNEAISRTQIFFSELVKASTAKEPNLVLREVLWDLPILLLCAWSGWWTSRRNLILTAFAPSLALHALILNYTEKHALSLQVEAFAFIFLLGIHQNWNLNAHKKQEDVGKSRNDALATLFVLSFVIALFSGWAPVFSLQETAKKIAERQHINETLGLERKVAQSYTVTTSGLPREHLISAPPAQLLNIVFTASTGEQPVNDKEDVGTAPIPRRYWRWLTYDLYNGQNWLTSPIQSNSYAPNDSLFQFTGTGYEVIHQKINKSSTEDTRLYWTGALVSVNQPFEATWRVQPPTKNAILDMDMLGAITNSQSYSADSILPLLNETELRAAPQTYPKEIRDKYIKLPASISPRVLDLAQQLTANSENAYDKAKDIETYLRTTYPYTLDVPPLPPNKEIADYFLFELKKGYCDYYATSMIVLARAAGLPARLVIGYASGDYDRAKAEYIVRELHAHSWVEIYFPQVGWVEFEPTASQPVIERPLNASDSQVSFEASAFRRDRDGRDYLKFGHFGKENDRSAYIPFIGMFIVIAGIVVYYLYTQGLRLTYPTIGSIYQYIYLHGQLLYQNSPVHETPSLFAEKLKKRISLNRRMLHPAADELDTLTRLYLQETYSAHPITQDERVEAIKIWRKLFWRLLYVRVLINRSLGD